MNRFQTVLSISTCAATWRAFVERRQERPLLDLLEALPDLVAKEVGRRRLTVSKPVLKVPMVSAHATKM